MLNLGKEIRMLRLKDRKTGMFLCVPMDHGISLGPVYGLMNMPKAIQMVAMGGATSVLLHRGMVDKGFRRGGKDVGLILNLSGSTTVGGSSLEKVIITTVEEAVALGADGVAVHINLGTETETKMIHDAGKVIAQANRWGVPVFVLIYPRGKDIGNEFDPDLVQYCARVAAELGADVVMTNYTGDPETFRTVTAACPVPLIVTGGPKMDSDKSVLKMVHDAVKAGAKGVSLGRYLFQHRDPKNMTRAVKNILCSKWTVTKASQLIKKK